MEILAEVASSLLPYPEIIDLTWIPDEPHSPSGVIDLTHLEDDIEEVMKDKEKEEAKVEPVQYYPRKKITEPHDKYFMLGRKKIPVQYCTLEKKRKGKRPIGCLESGETEEEEEEEETVVRGLVEVMEKKEQEAQANGNTVDVYDFHNGVPFFEVEDWPYILDLPPDFK